MPPPRILIVDDDPAFLDSFRTALAHKGCVVSIAEDGRKGLYLLSGQTFDVVLLDMRMPGMDGLQTLQAIMALRPGQTVLVFTGEGSLESALEAGRLGAFDYLEKPSTPDAVHLRIRRALEHRQLAEENRLLRQELRAKQRLDPLIGTSPPMQAVHGLIRRIAPTESTVLVTGETGTGKELVARALHDSSARADQRFFALHCAAIPEELLESELFGHERGAFTGAFTQKIGVFEAADGGTLFLDEIGEMSAAAQVRLLRVLQEREFLRVGSTTPVRTDVRLVTATNRDLEEEVRSGHFREDLFYRLDVIRIHLPPLRDRRDDIPLLVRHFLRKHSHPGMEVSLDRDAEILLVRHDWPGNVRELENVIERAVALSVGPVLTPQDLPDALIGSTPPSPRIGTPFGHLSLQAARESFERTYIDDVLTRTGGNITHAAKLAGIAWQNFHQKLKKYGIDARAYAKKKP